MDRGHTVGAVRTDDGEIGHSDVLGGAFRESDHSKDHAARVRAVDRLFMVICYVWLSAVIAASESI